MSCVMRFSIWKEDEDFARRAIWEIKDHFDAIWELIGQL